LESNISIKEALAGDRVSSIGFFTGPEGGFEDHEIEKVRNIGAATVTLGRRILRTETTGIVVLAIIMYQYDQLKQI